MLFRSEQVIDQFKFNLLENLRNIGIEILPPDGSSKNQIIAIDKSNGSWIFNYFKNLGNLLHVSGMTTSKESIVDLMLISDSVQIDLQDFEETPKSENIELIPFKLSLKDWQIKPREEFQISL